MIGPDGRSSYDHDMDGFLSREFAAEATWIQDKLRRIYLDSKTDAELANVLIATADRLRDKNRDVQRWYNGGNTDAWRQNDGVLSDLTTRVALYAEVAAARFAEGGEGAHPDLKPAIEKLRQGLIAGQKDDGLAVARSLEGVYPALK